MLSPNLGCVCIILYQTNQLDSLSREDLIKFVKKQAQILHKTKARCDGMLDILKKKNFLHIIIIIWYIQSHIVCIVVLVHVIYMSMYIVTLRDSVCCRMYIHSK